MVKALGLLDVKCRIFGNRRQKNMCSKQAFQEYHSEFVYKLEQEPPSPIQPKYARWLNLNFGTICLLQKLHL